MTSSGINKTILDDFKEESLTLVRQCLELLESIENDPSEVEKLSVFADKIDRVASAARSIAIIVPMDHPLHLIGDHCAICKSVGSQGALVIDNSQLYSIVVALLLDAVEMTKMLLEKLETLNSSPAELKGLFKTAYIERLKWISAQFDELEKIRNKGQKMRQNEIDALLRKLGL